MVTLRLSRQGGKKNPHYRVVATDRRAKRDGAFIEQIGHYDPAKGPATARFDETKLQHWLSVGALPSVTVAELIRATRKAAATAPAA